jgi:probable nitrogen fixation protein
MADALPVEDLAVADSPFLGALALLIRADDRYGAWDGKSDEQLLRPYVLTKEDRQAIPIIGNPDPDTVERLELFYKAVAYRTEKASGLMPSLMLKMHNEGFGWAVLIAGRLVVHSRHHRDIHRFGFPSRAKLAEEGETHVAAVLAMIEAHPEVARL